MQCRHNKLAVATRALLAAAQTRPAFPTDTPQNQAFCATQLPTPNLRVGDLRTAVTQSMRMGTDQLLCHLRPTPAGSPVNTLLHTCRGGGIAAAGV
jgi:hypothetical protein